MWLYTSYAVQPARLVASKYGERRYHGPKYNVALSSSISGRSFTMSGRPLSVPGGRCGLPSDVESSFKPGYGATPSPAATAGSRLNEGSGRLRDGDLLAGVDERHLDHRGRAVAPFGLNGHGLAEDRSAGGEPRVADVLTETGREDRRGHLADRLAAVHHRPLHVVELGEPVAVHFDAVDPALDAALLDLEQGF